MRALLYILLASAAVPQEPGSIPPPSSPAAQVAARFLAAFRAGDEAAMARAAEEAANPDVDAFFVVDALLGLQLDPAQAAVDLARAAVALAERTKAKPGNGQLPSLIEYWQRMEPGALASERAARGLYDELALANQRREQLPKADEAADVKLLELAEKARAQQALPVTAVALAVEAGLAFDRASRIEAAVACFRAAAASASAIGWIRGRRDALRLAVGTEAGRSAYAAVVELLQEELPLDEELGDAKRAAAVLFDLAISQQRLGQLDEARAALQRAEQLFQQLDDGGGQAKAVETLGVLHLSRGEWALALPAMERALERWTALDEPVRAAMVRGLIGNIHREAGDAVKALPLLQAAQRELEALGAKAGREAAMTLGNLGLAHQALGQFRQAFDCHERAHRAKKELGYLAGASISMLNMGQSLESMGQFADAIDCYERALAEMEARGEIPVAAVTLQNLGALYQNLGEFERALSMLERALALKEHFGNRYSIAVTLLNLSGVHEALGHFDQALAAAERALLEFEGVGSRAGIAEAVTAVASSASALGQHEHALEMLPRALDLFAELGDRRGVGRVLGAMGDVHGHLEDYAKAVELHEKSLAEEEATDPRATATTHGQLAELRLELGDHAGAMREARLSLDGLGARLQGLGDTGSFGLRAVSRRPAECGVLAAQALLSSDAPGRDAHLGDAFWFAETSRGMELIKGILNREALVRTQLPEALRNGEREARDRVTAALTRLSGAQGAEAAAVRELRLELDGAYQQLEEAIARTQREAARVAALIEPRPADLPAVQAALRPEECLVLCMDTSPGLVALVVTREGSDVVSLGETDWVETVQSYLGLASTPGSDEAELAARLYDRLLRPLEGMLLDKRRILVSPDGALAFLPFEALLRKQEEAAERVVHRWEVAYVPSGTVLATLREENARTRPGSGLLAVGDPVYPGEETAPAKSTPTRDAELRGLGNLRRLPETGHEVRAVGSLFPQKDLLLREHASVAEFARSLEQLAGRRLAAVHLACHGHVDTRNPRLTGLVLAGAEVLTLDALYQLVIPADLAVLSACETGKGKLLHGEGVAGLVRGFFFAGCPRVVVSDWRVADAGTREFMVAFYKGIVEHGLSPCTALRRAKLERLERGGPDAHPYHWAAFVLWGVPD